MAAITDVVVNPRSTCSTLMKLAISSPPTTSSIAVSATSPLTSHARIAVHRPAGVVERADSLSVSPGSIRAARHAGTSVQMSAQTTVTAAMTKNDVVSRRTSSRRGTEAGAVDSIARRESEASARPAAPPAKARSRLSTATSCTRRDRPAPMAVRIASSRWRAVQRAPIKPATFTQAMSNAAATAPRTSHSGRRASAVTAAINGRATA